MSEQAPTIIYKKDQPLFEKLRAMPMPQLLEQPVASLPLATRALSYCKQHGLVTLGQLSAVKREDMLNAKNMGAKTVQHVEAYLHELGLGLDGWRAASAAAPMPSAWSRGAKAMRFAIMAELSVRNVPFDIISHIGRMPVPNPDEEL